MENNNIERRYFSCETRADKESRTITGYAAVFDELSRNLGWFREKIDQKAFDNTNMDDVLALFNHDMNIVLARTISDTLKLSVDEKGLKYEFQAPDTTAGNDLLELISRGDIRHSSFAFSVSEDKWEDDDDAGEIRTVLSIARLYDVSPVTQPAYPQTTAAKRSYEKYQEAKKPEPETQEQDDHKDLKAERRERTVRIRQLESQFFTTKN